jgi:hypothetical protein
MAHVETTMTASPKPGSGSVIGAYALLAFTALIWAGNAVAGKWAVGQVSPLALTSLRWMIA